MKKKLFSFLLELNRRFMLWGYKRYVHRKEKIEFEVAKVVISNIGTSAFWLAVSIFAGSCYWLFTLMTLVPVYCYWQLTKAGFVWKQSLTVWSFMISGFLYLVSFLIQLSKTTIEIPFSVVSN